MKLPLTFDGFLPPNHWHGDDDEEEEVEEDKESEGDDDNDEEEGEEDEEAEGVTMMMKKRVMMMNKKTFSLFSMSSTEGVGVGGHSSFGGSFIFASSNTT